VGGRRGGNWGFGEEGRGEGSYLEDFEVGAAHCCGGQGR